MIEVRDKVAGLDGWTDLGQGFWKHRANRVRVSAHPIPDTLDACAAAWDRHAKGWVWTKGCAEWLAYRHPDDDDAECAVWTTGGDVPNAASELRDRWALLGEVLKARGVRRTKRVKPRDSLHARERAFQRYGHYITNDREIVRQITAGAACRVCELDNAKLLYVVRLGQQSAFVVYDPKGKAVVTCLPPERQDYRLVQAMADVILRQSGRQAGQTPPNQVG